MWRHGVRSNHPYAFSFVISWVNKCRAGDTARGSTEIRAGHAEGHLEITLPNFDRTLVQYRLVHPCARELTRGGELKSRILYAAAHVVCDPLADTSPAARPNMLLHSSLQR